MKQLKITYLSLLVYLSQSIPKIHHIKKRNLPLGTEEVDDHDVNKPLDGQEEKPI